LFATVTRSITIRPTSESYRQRVCHRRCPRGNSFIPTAHEAVNRRETYLGAGTHAYVPNTSGRNLSLTGLSRILQNNT
jgi:hypothetical protein